MPSHRRGRDRERQGQGQGKRQTHTHTHTHTHTQMQPNWRVSIGSLALMNVERTGERLICLVICPSLQHVQMSRKTPIADAPSATLASNRAKLSSTSWSTGCVVVVSGASAVVSEGCVLLEFPCKQRIHMHAQTHTHTQLDATAVYVCVCHERWMECRALTKGSSPRASGTHCQAMSSIRTATQPMLTMHTLIVLCF